MGRWLRRRRAINLADFKQRIVEPLGMNNTFLNVPEAYQGRLIEVVGADMAPPDRAVLYSTLRYKPFNLLLRLLRT